MRTIHLGAGDDGTIVYASVGDVVVVVLEENATTGYRWVVRDTGGALTLVADGYAASPPGEQPPPGMASDEPVLGRGGQRELRFRAATRGRAELVLTLQHEWEDDAEAIARWSVTIDMADDGGSDDPRPTSRPGA